jgi:hypothetical protein
LQITSLEVEKREIKKIEEEIRSIKRLYRENTKGNGTKKLRITGNKRTNE